MAIKVGKNASHGATESGDRVRFFWFQDNRPVNLPKIYVLSVEPRKYDFLLVNRPIVPGSTTVATSLLIKSLCAFFLPEHREPQKDVGKRSSIMVFLCFLVTFLTFLSYFSSLLCQIPFAGLLVRQFEERRCVEQIVMSEDRSYS